MKIVGIMMVKNEERFIRQAALNVLDFCDKLIVLDTGSTDQTIERVYDLPVDVRVQRDLSKTHDIIQEYVGTDTWIFGVDGDELYDPIGLCKVKSIMLHDSDIQKAWRIKGAYLHVLSLNDLYATGWLGPPSHCPTKLYNMAQIESWPSDGKHTLFQARTRKIREEALLHGTTTSRLSKPTGEYVFDQTWERALLRCLHLRFIPRSSIDVSAIGPRLTPEDIQGFGSRRDRGNHDEINERMSYRRGDLVTVRADAFFGKGEA